MKHNDENISILISYNDFDSDLKYFCIPKSNNELYKKYKGIYGFVNSCALTDKDIKEFITNMHYALYNRENPDHDMDWYRTELSKELDKYIVDDPNNLNTCIESVHQVGWLL